MKPESLLKSLLDKKEKEYFYIMHLSYDGGCKEPLWECAKENNVIGLNHCRIIEHDWRTERELVKNCISKVWARQLDMFCELKKDDIVVVLDGWYYILGIAEKPGECNYNKNLSNCEDYNGGFFGYTREVEWAESYEWGKRCRLSNPVRGFNNTLNIVNKDTKWWTSLTNSNV